MNTAEFIVTQGGASSSGRVSGDELLNVLGNFCNLWMPDGSICYTPSLSGAPESYLKDALRLQADNGSTHFPFGPPTGGKAYPGVPWDNPDFWSDLPRLRGFVERLLDTPSADGRGFRPILFLGGDDMAQSHVERWPDLAEALDGLHENLITLVAWEPVVGGYTSKQLSDVMIQQNKWFPKTKKFGHGSPTRWVGSSNPVEPDDPWQGGESEFFRSHGGEFLDGWFYQLPHGPAIYEQCTCPNADQKFGHRDECPWNRWEDGVARLGAGYNGWKKVKVVGYETVAYEAFRGWATAVDARNVATQMKRVADKWGVDVGWCNGLPWAA